MDFLSGEGDQVPLGKASGAAKPSKHGKMGFAANEGEEEDLFAEFDLGELEGGAAAPTNPEQAGDEDASKTVAAASSPASAAAAKAFRPPLHPNKPSAVQQQQQAPTGTGQDRCNATAPASHKEQEQGAEEVQEADLAPAVTVATAVPDGGEIVAPAPVTLPAQPMPALCARATDAVAAAAPQETHAPPSTMQPAEGSTLAAVVAGKVPAVEAGKGPSVPPAISPAAVPAPQAAVTAAAATGADDGAAAGSQHPAADSPAARQGLLHPPAPAPRLAPAPRPSLPTKPGKPAVPARAGALLPTPAAAPRRAAPGVLTPTTLGGFLPGSAATPSPTFRLQGLQAKLPGGAGIRAPSRLKPQGPGATFALSQQRQMSSQQATPHRLPTAAATPYLASPSFALPKHVQAAAPKPLTPAPVTPAGYPASAAAAAASEQRAQHAVQAQQAAVLADEVLSFSFEAAVARVLGGHQDRVQQSLALAEPMAEEVQQQVLALEQLGLQSEALRRQVSSLGVDLTIYRSSLAFMDSPVQAQSFSAATRKAEALWCELSAYKPPSIQHLLPAQTPEVSSPGGSEVDCCMADSPRQAGSRMKADGCEGDGQAPGGEQVPASECEAMDSEGSPVQPRALEAAFNRGDTAPSGGEDSSSQGSQSGTPSPGGALEAALSLEQEQEDGGQGQREGVGLLPDTEAVQVLPDTELALGGATAGVVPPTQEEGNAAEGGEDMEVDGAGAGGSGAGEMCVSLVLTAADDSVSLSIS